VKSTTRNKTQFILLAGPVVGLAMTPYLTFDALNPPKLMALAIFGGIALGTLVTYRQKLMDPSFRPIIISSTLLIFSLIASFLFSDSNRITQLYGVHGRHTGLIAYFSLCFLMLAVSLNVSLQNIRYALRIHLILGVFSFAYGFLQVIGLEPLPWNRSESWVVGTFANPNFFSSFVALVNISLLTYVFQDGRAKKMRAYSSILFMFGMYLLIQIGSTQGFMVLFIGSSFVLLIRIRMNVKLSKMFYPLMLSIFFGMSIMILDILQKTPWDSKLYKLSVSTRGDYWRAAMQIIRDHPLTGVGIDGFRNWYPVYRDFDSLNNGEASTLTDAAHNVFLDFGVNGGLILLISYVSMLILTLIATVRIIKRMQSFNPAIIGVIGVWIGYQTQSLVSINHLGLAVFGWIYSGLIIGYELHDRPKTNTESNERSPKIQSGRNSINGKSSQKLNSWASPLVGAILGFSLVWPLMSAHINYNTAMENADPILLLKAANQFPKDALRMSMAAESVSLMGFPRDGYGLAKQASIFDPNFSVPWKVMATFPRVSEDEKKQIQEKLNELDPLFNEAEKRRLALK
jgi:O-antigen ligase